MKVLVVVDMQNDFIDGALGTAEAVKIVPFVAEKIKQYKAKGYPVVFTRDTHTDDYMNTAEGKKLPVSHCIKGSEGWNISTALDVGDSAVLDKPSFGSLELAEFIAQNYKDTEEIELIGLCTDICVISNAMILKAKFPETIISVDAACTAGVTEKSKGNALEAMKMCHIDVK